MVRFQNNVLHLGLGTLMSVDAHGWQHGLFTCKALQALIDSVNSYKLVIIIILYCFVMCNSVFVTIGSLYTRIHPRHSNNIQLSSNVEAMRHYNSH